MQLQEANVQQALTRVHRHCWSTFIQTYLRALSATKKMYNKQILWFATTVNTNIRHSQQTHTHTHFYLIHLKVNVQGRSRGADKRN